MTSPDLDLFQAYLDGDVADPAALEARLIAEPALADALMRLAYDDAILRDWALADAEPVTPTTPFRPKPWKRVTLVSGLAAAVALVVGVLPGPAAVVANLTDLQGDVFVRRDGQERPARGGEALFAGQQVRTVGPVSSAVVRFADTSRLELGSDTQIRLDEPAVRQVFLSEGVVVADVATEPRGGPLVLKTSHAEASGFGARFQFSSAPDATMVQTDAGGLQVTRTSDGRSIAVPAGSYILARQRVEPFTLYALPPVLSSSRFVVPEAALTVAYSPDGRLLATGSLDGTIKLWDAHDGRPLRGVPPVKRPVRSLAFSADSRYLLHLGDERTIRLFDPVDEGASAVLTRQTGRGEVYAVAFSGNAQSLVSLARNRDGTEMQRWDVATLEASSPVNYIGRLTCVAHDPESRAFAVGGADDLVSVLTGDGVLRAHWRAGQREVRGIAYSPDGRQLATAGNDATVKLWDAATGAEQGVLSGHLRPVLAVAYSPDGRQLASVGDGSVKLWDVEQRKERTTIRGLRHAVIALAFAHDGRRLATVGADKTVRVWDVAP